MRHPLLFFCSLLFVILTCSELSAQRVTRIITSEGETFTGEIIVESRDTITLRSTSGTDIMVPRVSIERIDYNYDPSGGKNDSFWAFGATLGTPALLNLVVAYNFNDDWGLRFSGGYVGSAAGLQLDGTYLLGGDKVRHNLNFGLGLSGVETGWPYGVKDWAYLEGGYNLQVWGFDLMLGISVGDGDYTNPQLLGQIGYVHRFWD